MESPSAYVRHCMEHLPEPERAIAYMRLDTWALLAGATPYEGRARRCLGRLTNPRHRCGNACYWENWPWALDHAEWWRGPGGGFIVSAHPYDMGPQRRAELETLEASYGIRLLIDEGWSWYVPSSTVLVVLTGNPPRPPVRRTKAPQRGQRGRL